VYTYSAYGLSVHSEFPLPEMSVHHAPADLVVRVGAVDERPPPSDRGGSWYRVSPSESCLFWEEVGTFLIRNGSEIVVDPSEGVGDGMLRQAVIGPAFAMLLQQRGFFPLHAAVVVLGEEAIALAGESGSGKSTLAAALHARGNALLSDDIAAISFDTPQPVTYPGFPRFRLWPETATCFGEKVDALPRLHSGTEKRLVEISSGFATTEFPLRRIYILADSTSESIAVLPRQEGLLLVMRLCYNLELIQAAVGIPALMKQCARLVEAADVCILKRRRSLRTLPELAATVEGAV
jgi:hypothetical protein